MTLAESSELEFELRKLIVRYSALFAYHRWPSEHERWVELAFALLTTVSDLPEDRIRAAVEALDALDLLAVDALAVGAGADDRASRRIDTVLEEAGFSPQDARRARTSLGDAACSLIARHDGKIQLYLRAYGQRMLDELPEHFSFRELDRAQVDRAFRYWLQNVLNMPVALPHASVDAFAAQLGVTRDALVEAADRLGLNLALLDDMVAQRERDASEPEHQP